MEDIPIRLYTCVCTRMFGCVYLCIRMFVRLLLISSEPRAENSACLPLIIGLLLLLFQFFALSLNNWNWKLTSASNRMPELLVSARPKKMVRKWMNKRLREWEIEKEREITQQRCSARFTTVFSGWGSSVSHWLYKYLWLDPHSLKTVVQSTRMASLIKTIYNLSKSGTLRGSSRILLLKCCQIYTKRIQLQQQPQLEISI